MKKRRLLACTLSCLMAAGVLLTGCSSSSDTTGGQASSAGDSTASAASDTASASGSQGKKYAIVLRSTGNPYCEKEGAGFKDTVTKLGGEAIIKMPEQATAEAQITMVQELITQNVNGIAIASNDIDGLQPILTKAMAKGIHVISLDSTVNKDSRETHVNQADPAAIGKKLVEAVYDMTGGSGEFAILSATSQAANQNAWIAQMQEALKDSKYANLKLDKIAYGDDLRDKSTTETEGLLKSYPNLKCIVSPTTVGIAAASKVLVDQGYSEKIKITGLGLPSEMSDYIEKGVCPYMYLWNPSDVGSLAAYTLDAIVQGKITGKVGDTFTAGDFGQKKITAAEDGGTEVLMGDPFKFDKENIAEWKTVY